MSGRDRLHPPAASSRYYPLTRLRAELSKIADELGSLGLGSKEPVLVDLGCGEMPYRPLFATYSGRYIGIDLPDNKHADVHFTSNASRTPLHDGVADIVLSTQVLEHVDNPQDYLAECNRLLNANGLLIVSTHGYWPYHPSPADYWRWTGAGLKKIIQESGFQILRLVGVMGLAATAIQLFQDALSRRVPRFVRPIFFFTMQRLVTVCDHLHSPEQRELDASIFIIIARKESLS